MLLHTITIAGPKAILTVHHERAYDFDEKRGLWLYRQVGEDEHIHNLLLDACRVQLHRQCYYTSGLLANGFNFIGLSNDGTSPAAGDTTLTGELSGNGLDRAQGVVTPPTGAGTQTTIAKTFTYTGSSQQVQKSALFTASSSGVMGHEVLFTQRTLVTNDTLAVSYTITLGA